MNKEYKNVQMYLKVVNIGVIYKIKYYFFLQICFKKENFNELYGFMVIISI